MAVLPIGGVTLSQGVRYRQQPSLTWKINKGTNRIEGNTDRLDAVRQAAEIILNTERFRWQIYRPYSGVSWMDLIGQESGFVGAELPRRIRDALTVDDRIIGISGFSYSANGNVMTVSFSVDSVYGSTGIMEVSLT